MRYLYALLAALILLAPAPLAQAQELAPAEPPSAEAPVPEDAEIKVGAGLVCDTPEQVRRYVELFEGDAEAAAAAVNAEAGSPEACSFGVVAFVRGEDRASVRDKDNQLVQVAEIVVVGIGTEAGLTEIRPVRWYTLFPAEGVQI